MNYVKNFNFYGVEAQQIPCMTGEDAPTKTTEGEVGCLYMDLKTSKMYKCIQHENGNYVWKEIEYRNNVVTLNLTNGAISSSGVVANPDMQTMNNYYTTNIEYYDNLEISLLNDNLIVAIAYYDENGTFVERSNWQSKAATSLTSGGVDKIVIQNKYIRILLAAYPTHQPAADGGVYVYTPEEMLGMLSCSTEIDTMNTASELNGKKWLFIGDSITEHNFRATKNYDEYLAECLGIVPVNRGMSGTGVTYSFQGNPSWLEDLNNLPLDVDVISIMGGLNDRHTALGEWGDRGTDTVYGAVWNYFNNLITKYPNTPIVYITSTPREYSYGVDGDYTGWVDAFIKTAHNFSIPVLDLYRNSGLRPWNSTNNAEYFSSDTSPTGDGVHPNAKGQQIIAKKILPFALQYLAK